MDTANTKKHLIILVLRILETNTDKNTPLTQTEIAKMISAKFPCDRKTVGRNLKFLEEVGYPIVKTTKGFYMNNKTFSKDEISLVIDLVKNSALDEHTREDLCERLYECLTRYYKR